MNDDVSLFGNNTTFSQTGCFGATSTTDRLPKYTKRWGVAKGNKRLVNNRFYVDEQELYMKLHYPLYSFQAGPKGRDMLLYQSEQRLKKINSFHSLGQLDKTKNCMTPWETNIASETLGLEDHFGL